MLKKIFSFDRAFALFGVIAFTAAILFAQPMRTEGVIYVASLPSNGTHAGQLAVVVSSGSDNGLYMWNANDEAWEYIGGDSATLTPATVTATGQILGYEDSTAAAPAFAFTGETNFGLYASGGTLSLSANGSRVFAANGTYLQVDDLVVAGAGATFSNSWEYELYTKTVTVSATQIRNLAGSPKTLVAAIANEAIIPVSITIAYRGGANAFDSVEAGEDLVLRYTDGLGTIVSQTVDTTDDINLGSTTDVDYFVAPLTEFAMTQNGALVLDNVGAGELASADNDANGDGTLSITLMYIVFDAPA